MDQEDQEKDGCMVRGMEEEDGGEEVYMDEQERQEDKDTEKKRGIGG